MKINPFPEVAKCLEVNGLTIDCDASRLSVYGPVNFEIKNAKSSIPLVQKLMGEHYGAFDRELRPWLEKALVQLLNAGAGDASTNTPNTTTTAANPFI